MNPYRDAFYKRQAQWHGYLGAEDVARRHAERVPYYRWYTQGWLDVPRSTPVLDIGCGSGQFLYFLREQGFTDMVGIDVDPQQVEIGRALGLDCRCASVVDFLHDEPREVGLVAMLDILEHFTREELFEILEAVTARLAPGGRLFASVPNAESPGGLHTTYADITHEIAFTPLSLEELLFCHGLRVSAYRDPWPAPVSPLRRCYRLACALARSLESVRLRLLGIAPPRIWSPVLWAMAEKTLSGCPDARAGCERRDHSALPRREAVATALE
jgi:2-polyprenyl-3-methyl-5-hydroxy-6-metoxy-1,4-benzoquinol methylase